ENKIIVQSKVESGQELYIYKKYFIHCEKKFQSEERTNAYFNVTITDIDNSIYSQFIEIESQNTQFYKHFLNRYLVLRNQLYDIETKAYISIPKNENSNECIDASAVSSNVLAVKYENGINYYYADYENSKMTDWKSIYKKNNDKEDIN